MSRIVLVVLVIAVAVILSSYVYRRFIVSKMVPKPAVELSENNGVVLSTRSELGGYRLVIHNEEELWNMLEKWGSLEGDKIFFEYKKTIPDAVKGIEFILTPTAEQEGRMLFGSKESSYVGYSTGLGWNLQTNYIQVRAHVAYEILDSVPLESISDTLNKNIFARLYSLKKPVDKNQDIEAVKDLPRIISIEKL